jgi:F420H(2)-dependent biliverdin reductase
MTRNERLMSERNIWLSTTRRDGRPHMTPIWFVFVADCVWICTSSNTVKARNLLDNPSVSFALEDGDRPVVGEGTAAFVAATDEVVREFQRKFDWDITGEPAYDAVMCITVTKWLQTGGVEP